MPGELLICPWQCPDYIMNIIWRGLIGKRDQKRGICGICSAGCWVIAEYDGQGRIKRLRPDESTPMGILCRLGEHARDIIYSEDRLLHPLRRKGLCLQSSYAAVVLASSSSHMLLYCYRHCSRLFRIVMITFDLQLTKQLGSL